MQVNKLDNNCYYYTEIIDDNEANNLLNIIKINEGWNEAFVDERPYDVNKDKDLDVNQGLAKAYRKSFDEKLYPEVFNTINLILKKVCLDYLRNRNMKVKKLIDKIAVIDKHLEGQVYKTHIDTIPTNEESYTVILYLNDDYEGGEISFSFIDNPEINNGIVKSKIKGTYPPYHEKNKDLISFWVKPKKFSVVIFPPTYQHTVHEVTGSEKYLVKAFWQTGNNMVKSDIKLNEFEK